MGKRRFIAIAAAAMLAMTSLAQGNKLLHDARLSGYGMMQYQASDKEGSHQNSFSLRLARVSLDGRATPDFAYKLQMQVNGNIDDTAQKNAAAIRLVDLWGEWQHFDFLKIKVGQFKRPFTFENPMHPITQGFMSYSQNVTRLAGFSDRTGEQPSNGRDIGMQLQGDMLKHGGRYLLHYQVGLFNGEGINVKDKNNRKDIIGGLWVMPVDGLRLGAFGWNGYREGVGEKNRYALSAEYAHDDWTWRSEYIHSQGYGDDITQGDKADGLYALVIAPAIKNKCHVKARYDLYRNKKSWQSAKTYYEVGADYLFNKNLQLNVEYARVNERSTHQSYNMIDVEIDVRF